MDSDRGVTTEKSNVGAPQGVGPPETTVSQRKAAKELGVSERTLRRWIAKGEVSTVPWRGTSRIEWSELVRVIDSRKQEDTDRPEPPALSSRVQELEARVHDLDRQLSDMRADRDRWADQAQTLARALPPATSAPPEEPRRPWWRRKIW